MKKKPLMPWLTKNKAQIKSSKKVSKSYHHKVLHAAPVKPQRAFKLIRSLLLSNTPQHIQSFLLTLEKASVLFPLWANPSFCTKTRPTEKGATMKTVLFFSLSCFFLISSRKSHGLALALPTASFQ